MLKVVMVIGVYLFVMFVVVVCVLFGVDECVIVGGLFGVLLQFVCILCYGIGVFVVVEFVFEGMIDFDVYVEEGLFGEFIGYLLDCLINNVLCVDMMMWCDDVWFVDVVGGLYVEYLIFVWLLCEVEMSEKFKVCFLVVIVIYYLNFGMYFYCYVVLKQLCDGEVCQIMFVLFGWDLYLKNVVVVDSDIDIIDDVQVLWVIVMYFQLYCDLFVVDGLFGSLFDLLLLVDGMML